MHQRSSNNVAKPASGPDCSVPATGWQGTKYKRSGNAAATQGASFLFFPLSFLTATFVPVDLLSGWIKTAAIYNPITYILEAMRTLLNTGWDAEIMARGFASILLMAIITYTFAIFSLRARVRRK